MLGKNKYNYPLPVDVYDFAYLERWYQISSNRMLVPCPGKKRKYSEINGMNITKSYAD